MNPHMNNMLEKFSELGLTKPENNSDARDKSNQQLLSLLTPYLVKCKSPQDLNNLMVRYNDGLLAEFEDDGDLLLHTKAGVDSSDRIAGIAEDYAGKVLTRAEMSINPYDDPTCALNIEAITRYHLNILRPDITPEDIEEDKLDAQEELDYFEESISLEEKLNRYLTEEFVRTEYWNTWGDCLVALGYPVVESLHGCHFDSPFDLVDILNQRNYNQPPYEETPSIQEKYEFIIRFFEGDLTENELRDLVSDIFTHVEHQKEEEAEFSGDSDDEINEEIEVFYDMVSHAVYQRGRYLVDDATHPFQQVKARFEQINVERDDCYDELKAIWNETELIHDRLDDRKVDEDGDELEGRDMTKKRNRIEFDIRDKPLQEIRFEQKQVDNLLDEENFHRLLQEVVQEFPDYRLDLEAMKTIQVAAEAYLVETFEDANRAAIHARRTHIAPKDIQMVRSLKRERE